jgi:hypothetical protein
MELLFALLDALSAWTPALTVCLIEAAPEHAEDLPSPGSNTPSKSHRKTYSWPALSHIVFKSPRSHTPGARLDTPPAL